MIRGLDSHVGRVLEALDQAGVAERTLVVFSSDNGSTHPGRGGSPFHVGGADPTFLNGTAGLRGFKGSVYEGGLRVPAIARLPGKIPSGTASDVPGYFADWFPTLCEAAGLEAPAATDGQSLWPLLTGREQTLARGKPMLWVFPEYGGQVAVRLGDFKLVRRGLATRSPGPWEVYDLAADPGETIDVASSKAPLVRQAEELLRQEVDDNDVFPLTIPGPTP
jgi:arylsulfatase A-like enzyme